MLVRLYNSHDFDGEDIEHTRFKWKPETIVFIVSHILYLITIIVFVLLLLELKVNTNNLFTFILIIFSRFLFIIIILVILTVIQSFLTAYLSAKVIHSHWIKNDKVLHRRFQEENKYIVLWFIGLLSTAIVGMYLVYKVAERYSWHKFS